MPLINYKIMTTPKPAAPPEQPPAQSQQPKEFTLTTVYGLMIDPHNGEQYTQKPRKVAIISDWVDSQIKAGKILVE